jgi:hypothetical protein
MLIWEPRLSAEGCLSCRQGVGIFSGVWIGAGGCTSADQGATESVGVLARAGVADAAGSLFERDVALGAIADALAAVQ